MSRKLGENDPGRYEIVILIGPCTLEEAEYAMTRAVEALRGDATLGAAVSLVTFDEETA